MILPSRNLQVNGPGLISVPFSDKTPGLAATERRNRTPQPNRDPKLTRQKNLVERDHDWRDKAIYGGLVAIRDIRWLDPSLIDDGTLQTFHGAMSSGNPFRVRQAAYHVILVTQNQWLKSKRSRQRLKDLDFFRQMYGVVVDTARSDYQQSFLTIMDIISQDLYWHWYLGKAMDIWLPFRREGPSKTPRIVANTHGLLFAGRGDQISSSLNDL
jgi:hypothetical protein